MESRFDHRMDRESCTCQRFHAERDTGRGKVFQPIQSHQCAAAKAPLISKLSECERVACPEPATQCGTRMPARHQTISS